MPFNINEFAAAIDTGLAHSSAYDIMVTGPSAIQSPDIQANLTFRSDAVIIPGRQAMTGNMLTMGPVHKIAYDSEFSPVDVSIIMSPGFEEKIYFQRWQSLAVGFATHTDQNLPGMFKIGYYEDYVGTVIITQYDPTGEVSYVCALYEAFPVTVSPVPGRWEDTQISRLLVRFDYYRFVDDPEFLGQAASFNQQTPTQ